MDIEKLLRHRPFVRALARRLVRDDARADDLVQDTYLTALKNPPKHEGALRAWLAAVVRNLARTQNRAEWRRTKHERKTPVDGGHAEPRALPSADETLEKATWHQRLVEATMALDEPYRSTLLLRYFEELDSTEIAQIQGVPAATVRTRIKRGVERLRSELDQKTPGGRATWVPALLLLAHIPGGVPTGATTATKSSFAVPAAMVGVAATFVVVAGLAVSSLISSMSSSYHPSRSEMERMEYEPAKSSGSISVDAPVYLPTRDVGHRIEVQVLDEGRPADGASVVVSRTAEHAWSVVPHGAWRAVDRGVADRNGRVNFAALRDGYLRIAAWRTGRARTVEYVWLPQKLAHPIVIDLAPETRHEVWVTSMASGQPIPGARIWLEDEGGGPREPGPDRASTDWHGVAELAGLGSGAEAPITVTAPGFRSTRARLPLDSVALEPADRIMRWPVASNGGPQAVKVVRPHGGERTDAAWAAGALEVGPIPNADWPEHWAVLDDGRYARLEAERGATQGTPITFEEPVRLTVQLSDTDGGLVGGVRLRLADAATGTHLYERRESWTDETGQVVLPVYARDPVLVLYRDATGTRWRALRTFDPADGDARAELKIAPARTVRIRFANGAERMAAHRWSLSVGRERLEPVRWQDDSWTVSVRRSTSPRRAVLHFLAKGYEPVSREVEPDASAAEIEWTLDPIPATRLAVRVRRAHPDQSFRLALVGDREQRGPGRYVLEVGPDGIARDATVPAGSHRVVDLVSGTTSAYFLASPGGEVDLALDLTHAGQPRAQLSGVLDGPAGFAIGSVRLEARPGGDVPIDPNGSFSVPWPEQGGVELVVERDGVVVHRTFVATPMDGMRLPVAPIASARFEVDRAPPAPAAGATRPRVIAVAEDGRTVAVEARISGRELTFAGIAPGRWSLTVDIPGLAPATRDSVLLAEGSNDLGSLALTPGTTLRLTIAPSPGNLPPELIVAAQAVQEPRYQRSIRTSGEATVALPGLGAGSMRVTVWNRYTGLRLWSGLVECDGVRERAVTIPLD